MDMFLASRYPIPTLNRTRWGKQVFWHAYT